MAGAVIEVWWIDDDGHRWRVSDVVAETRGGKRVPVDVEIGNSYAKWRVFTQEDTKARRVYRFRDEQHGMALGGRLLKADDRSDSVAAVTSDGGETWTLVNRPTFSGAVYGATVIPGMPGYVVVAGPKGLDWTGNDGRSWTNLSDSAYWAVDCISLHACWAVGPRGRITSVRF